MAREVVLPSLIYGFQSFSSSHGFPEGLGLGGRKSRISSCLEENDTEVVSVMYNPPNGSKLNYPVAKDARECSLLIRRLITN